ncbi:MAG: hypothetical protein MMC23_004614 [Stictis urceolatum]|nr:hypothetical protein [Stictis urceolata]
MAGSTIPKQKQHKGVRFASTPTPSGSQVVSDPFHDRLRSILESGSASVRLSDLGSVRDNPSESGNESGKAGTASQKSRFEGKRGLPTPKERRNNHVKSVVHAKLLADVNKPAPKHTSSTGSLGMSGPDDVDRAEDEAGKETSKGNETSVEDPHVLTKGDGSVHLKPGGDLNTSWPTRTSSLRAGSATSSTGRFSNEADDIMKEIDEVLHAYGSTPSGAPWMKD